MIWGEQWVCRCAWANVFVRRHCRNCGAVRPTDAPMQSPEEVIENVYSRAALAGGADNG